MPEEFLGERRTYDRKGLDREDLKDNPLDQLREWLAEAEQSAIVEPSAMAISSVSSEGHPSSRMVLLRLIDHGLVFFTNYSSRKGVELEAHPFASALFWWPGLERQVRIEGRVERVSSSESEAYFAGRPRESQLASAASPQSTEIPSREVLERRVEELAIAFPSEVPKPEHWGGYRLIPSRFEFWQGRPARFHDRFMYELEGGNWRIGRLAP